MTYFTKTAYQRPLVPNDESVDNTTRGKLEVWKNLKKIIIF